MDSWWMYKMIRVVIRNVTKCERLLNTRLSRSLSSETSSSEGEKRIAAVLKTNFPQATNITVKDISGGCGAMYEIIVESNEFRGLRTVQQHRLIHKVLDQEIKSAHGVRIHTSVPPG